MGGDPVEINRIVGQAYALRAHSYFYLIQIYQQTYKGNESKPGIPLYTEPTVAGSEGKPHGTVKEVYTLINADLEKAASLLKDTGQKDFSHIDYYVAKGIEAKVALVQHNYEKAIEAASEALKKPGLTLATVNDLGGNNNVAVADVMWGMKIIADQNTQYNSLFSHMDADAPGMYASQA